MDLFTAVKEVRTRDAAELYGFHPNKAGMIKCVFHQERTPSLWVSDGYYCHGCGAKGDAVAFTAQAFNLSPKDAALKLARDFGIVYDGKTTSAEIREKAEIVSIREQFEAAAHYFTTTAAYCCRKLRLWQKFLAPRNQSETPNTYFVLAVRYLPELDYILDEFARADLKERIDIITNYGKLVIELAGK